MAGDANDPRRTARCRLAMEGASPTEPVAVCYLDGAFGGGESGATGRACSPTTSCNSTPAPLPTWNRIVYLIGVDRHPIGMTYGSQVQIAIRDPGR